MSVIKTSTNAVVKTVTVGNGPWGVAITPNGGYAYVTNTASHTVSVIRTSTNTVVKDGAGWNRGTAVAITPNGKDAYVTNGSHTVIVIDTATNAVVKKVTVGQAGHSGSPSPRTAATPT